MTGICLSCERCNLHPYEQLNDCCECDDCEFFCSLEV